MRKKVCMGTMFFQSVRSKWSLFALCGVLTASSVHAATTTTTLSADGVTSTYTLIESVFGHGTSGEVPDPIHPEFGPHITQSWDSTLGKYIFNFFIHVTPDNDRTDGDLVPPTDRQRNEIKTMSGSPAALVAYQGDATSYHWFFKIDSGFQPSPSFTHIHQIKAANSGDDSTPLITLTPRAGSPEKLQIMYGPPTPLGGGQTEVASALLSSFKGQWVEANERMLNASNGTYQIVLKRVSDGAVLLSYTNNNIIMWRGGGSSAINRPKWGIYRSIVNSSYLRDEMVQFADFSITKGDETPPFITTSPTNLTVTAGQNATFTVAVAGAAPLYYQWRFNTTNNLSWAAGATLIITNAQSANAGSYAAVVSNSYGSVTSAVATLTIANAAPSVSLTAPVGGTVFAAPASIVMTADASDTDGTVTNVSFYNGSTLLGFDTSAPYAYTWTNVAAGSYNLTARATDDDGAVRTSAVAAVTVNAAPSVSLTAPVGGTVFAAPASVTMTANASDTDGTITTVGFYNGATLLGSDASSPYAYTWTNVAAGSYNLTARATDNRGAVSTSAIALVAVNPTYMLTVNGGSGGGLYLNGQQVAIAADAPASDKTFSQWIGDTQYVDSVSSPNTMITMPAWPVALTATYVNTYVLTVNSGSGDGIYISGTQVAIAADAPEEGQFFDQWIGDIQYVNNVTWTNALVTMPTNPVTLRATYNSAAVTLTASAGSGGSISPTNATVTIGGSTNFVITASNYYRIATLTTNGTAVTGMSFNNSSTITSFIWSNVQYSGTLAATFTNQVATNVPAPVPYSWLAGCGLTNYDTDAVADRDGDGFTTWQEYIAGTSPTNAASCLKAVQNTRNVITWSAVSGRVYSVYWSTNPVKGFQPLETNIPYTQSSYTNTTPDSRANYYQIKVRMQ